MQNSSPEKVSHVVARYPYIAKYKNEINFERGDRLEVIDIGEEGLPWLEARLNGRTGFVPTSFLIIPRNVKLPKKTKRKKTTIKSENESRVGCTDSLPAYTTDQQIYEALDDLYDPLPCSTNTSKLVETEEWKIRHAVELLTDEEWNELVAHRATHVIRDVEDVKDSRYFSAGLYDTTKPPEKTNENVQDTGYDVPLSEEYGSQQSYLSRKSWYTTKYIDTVKGRKELKRILLTRARDDGYLYPDGAFIVAKTDNGELSISVKYDDGIEAFKILPKGDGRFYIWVISFPTIASLIQYYKTRSISRKKDICLKETVIDIN